VSPGSSLGVQEYRGQESSRVQNFSLIRKTEIVHEAKYIAAYALEIIATVNEESVAAQSKEFIDRFIRLLRETSLSNLPPLRGFRREDNSLALEWIFKDFRVGLSFDLDVQESSWFFVSSFSAGSIQRYGCLQELTDRDIQSWFSLIEEHN
jgi:hypothetical protein